MSPGHFISIHLSISVSYWDSHLWLFPVKRIKLYFPFNSFSHHSTLHVCVCAYARCFKWKVNFFICIKKSSQAQFMTGDIHSIFHLQTLAYSHPFRDGSILHTLLCVTIIRFHSAHRRTPSSVMQTFRSTQVSPLAKL